MIVGRAEGVNVGRVDGCGVGAIVGALEVATAVGAMVGPTDGTNEGWRVGEYVTSCKPAPAMMAVPEQAVWPVQPSRIIYVWVAVPAGTVYCTCAQTLVPEMH